MNPLASLYSLLAAYLAARARQPLWGLASSVWLGPVGAGVGGDAWAALASAMRRARSRALAPALGWAGWVACVGAAWPEPAASPGASWPALVPSPSAWPVSAASLGACPPAAFALLGSAVAAEAWFAAAWSGPTWPVSAWPGSAWLTAGWLTVEWLASAPVALFPVVVLVGCADSAGTSSAEPASAFPGLFPPTVASTMCAAPRTSSAALL